MTLELRRRDHEAEPGSDPRRRAFAAALLAAGEAREALALLDEDRDDPEERVLLARVLHRLDRARRAERLLRDVIAADPLHDEAIRELAGIRIERGAPAEAVELLERLRRIAPEDGGGRALLGRAQRRLGLAESARRTLDAAVTIDPYNGAAHVELARLAESLGEWALAHESWEVAAELAAAPADEIARHLADCERRAQRNPGGQ